MSNLPQYRCHKIVQAMKIQGVIKHANPDPNADDAEFEASPAFEGAHLFPAEDRDIGPIFVDADWYRKHQPEEGGYYVLYQDGYASYSPAKAFEEGYTRVDEAETASEAGVEDVNLRATALNMAMQSGANRNPHEILKQAEKYFTFMKTGELPEGGSKPASVQPIKNN